MDEAAVVEPLAVAVHGCRRVPITKDSTVLVTGAGPIGLLVMATAKAYGARRVVVTEINEYRLGLAREMGADETLLFDRSTTEQQMVDKISEAFGGNLPDITLECSGVGINFRVVMLATKPGGHCMMIGIGPADYNLPIATASAREITILGAFRYQNWYVYLERQKKTQKFPVKVERKKTFSY